MKKLLVGTAIALSLCATSPAAAAAAKKAINVGLSADIASTEFATKHDDNTMLVLHHIMESLVSYRDDMTVAPNLAESWEVSGDGKTYTFRLRDGVKFHNGAPLTAGIVKWNFDRFMDPKRDWGSHCREQLDGSFEEYIRPAYIVGIDTPDARTVSVRLQSPNAMFLHHLASNHCIYGIVHPDSVGPQGEWKTPVATGPFKLAAWRKSEEVVLEQFRDYLPRGDARSGLAGARRANVDELRFKVIADRAEAKRQLEKGKIDLLVNVSPSDAATLERAKNVKLVPQVTPAFLQLIVQSRTDPMLRNPTLRKAIAHAVDRERLTREALGGYAKPNPSIVAATFPQHTAAHDVAPAYDVARAKQLLAEAGYKGEKLEILTSAQPYPIFLTTAQSVAAMLREAGINAVVREVDWATHDKDYGKNNYQLTTIAFSTRTDPTLMYSAIVGQKGDHAWYLWEDQEAEMLTTISAIEADPVKRQALFDRLHAKMIEWTPTIGLANYPRVDAVSAKLKGYEGWTLAIPRLWGVTKD